MDLLEDDRRFMEIALGEAEKALAKGEVPVGCICVKDNDVVARGHNLTNELMDATQHAEMVAMNSLHEGARQSPRLLEGCCLYVTCEPCIMCAAAISMQGVKRVVFGCANDKFGGTGSIMHLNQSIHADEHRWHGYDVVSGVNREEAINLFKRFYARENGRAPVKKRKERDPAPLLE